MSGVLPEAAMPPEWRRPLLRDTNGDAYCPSTPPPEFEASET